MGRRIALSIAAVVLAGLGVAASLPWLAARLATMALAAAGFQPASLSLAEIGMNRTVIADLRLGPEVAISRIVLDYALPALARGHLERIAVTGVEAAVRLDGAGLETGSVRLPFGGEATPSRWSIGRLEIEAARLAVGTPAGPLTLDADGAVAFEAAGPRGTMDLRLGTANGGADLRLELRDGDAVLTADGSGLETGAGSVEALRGTIRTRLDAAWRPQRIRGEMSARWLPPGAPAEISAQFEVADPLSADGTFTATGRLAAAAGRPGLQVSLTGARAGSEAVTLVLAGESGGGRLPGAVLGPGRVAASARLAWDDGGLTLDLTAPAELAVDRLSIADAAAELQEGARLTLPNPAGAPPALTWRRGTDPLAPDRFAYDLTARLTVPAATVAGESMQPAPVTVTGRGHWQAGREDHDVALSAAEIRLPARGLTASGIEARLTGSTGQGAAGQASLQRLAPEGPLPWMVPLAVELQAASADLRRLEGRLRAVGAEGRLVVQATGRHDLASGSGGAQVVLSPIRLAAGVLQPADLSPAAGRWFTDAEGGIAASGRLDWAPGQDLGGAVQLLIEGLGGQVGPARVTALNGLLETDRLGSPAQSEPQQLSAALIDLGIPLQDALIAVRSAGRDRLSVELERLSLAGGRVAAPPFVLDLAAPRLATVLQVTGIDLGTLLALAGLEGLEATGQLSGVLPVEVDADGAALRDGRLATHGPGTIRYRPAEVPAALQGGGEGVSLMLQAFRNFRYEDLWMTVNRAADGEARIGLHVRGANPDLYDGYPVELNVTLHGALDRIVRDSLSSYRVPEEIIERMRRYEANP